MSPDLDQDGIKHAQQTFLSLGDEFLIQYILCAHRVFRESQILSRLFSMGHSLELYAKGVLVELEGRLPIGHDLPNLITRCNPALALSPNEVAVGETLFAPEITNFDIGLWMQHKEAMELYQAQFFLKDLKYYITREGRIIYPARASLSPINTRYLELVRTLRTSMKHLDAVQDQSLVNLVEQLGFEENPACRVIAPPAHLST